MFSDHAGTQCSLYLRSTNKLKMSSTTVDIIDNLGMFNMAGTLKKISVDQLPVLRDMYKVHWPLHISTFSTIQLFIDRFAKHPEWIARVSFFSFDEDWKTCGVFIMNNENRIFFNTLETYPYAKLGKALVRMNFESRVSFINIRDALRPALFIAIRVHHFEVVSDIGTKSKAHAKRRITQN